MALSTKDITSRVDVAARKFGFSAGAVRVMIEALAAGHGRQAQFNHPEFGGMGQWSSYGMVMIGDMFNTELKARVDALCQDLSEWVGALPLPTRSQSQSQSQNERNSGFASAFREPAEWPAPLGRVGTSGSQNSMRYAYFPLTRRLAIEERGQMTVYDTGDHEIGGVSQQQGPGQTVVFTSQTGPVNLSELRRVDVPSESSPLPDLAAEAAPVMHRTREADSKPASSHEIVSLIETLADLHQKGILSAAEYEQKKADLLRRL